MRGRKYIAAVVLTLLFVTVFANFAYATQYVSGYYRSNGTYVQPYYRSNPDGYFYNNYSTYANINPYTGTLGTKRYPSYSSGYTRSYYSSKRYPSYSSGYTRSYYSSKRYPSYSSGYTRSYYSSYYNLPSYSNTYSRSYYKSSYSSSNLWDW